MSAADDKLDPGQVAAEVIERLVAELGEQDGLVAAHNTGARLIDRVQRWGNAEFDPFAVNGAQPSGSRVGDIDGATFALDAPATVPAIWGQRTEVLWPEGEALLIYGPDGVGKTTIAQQLVLRLIGIGLLPTFLDLAVQPIPEGKKVLYLALDRPRQAARSFRRMVADEDRDKLRERLHVWRGSVPFDILYDPGDLARFATQRKAVAVVIDSLKDLSPRLSDEDTGMAIKRAWDLCLEAGVEVLALHHPRKAQPENKRPITLADVYGSRWITAGAGSIVLIWGEAGDPVVDLTHLKQPADVVGSLKLLHDNRTGSVTVTDRTPDPVDLVLSWIGPAPTVREIAARLYDKPSEQVKANDKEKVRRRLNIGVSDGRLQARTIQGEGGDTTVYLAPKGGAR